MNTTASINHINLPRLECSDQHVGRLSVAQLATFLAMVLERLAWRHAYTVLAGMHYDRPWTRDAAINSWNALSFIWPDLAEETLTAVLTDDQQTGVRIGGQYWDAII